MAARKVLTGVAVLALVGGVLASVANAALPCGRKACSDEAAASGLKNDARRACLTSLISYCSAGLCSCTGGSPPCSCVCGDGLCGPSEDCGTCPQDCGTCPTTTTTSTTTSTTTTTTTLDPFRPCGRDPDGTCGGLCDSFFDDCVQDDQSGACVCVPGPCRAVGGIGSCGGTCQDPRAICTLFPVPGGCVCIIPCAGSGAPPCDPACQPGQGCIFNPNTSACECAP
jgi:hypothetical protein